MKYEILVWLIIGILAVIGFAIYLDIENADNKLIKNKEKGKGILSSVKFLIFILYITTQIPSNYRYDLYNEKEEFAKYKTPQVDSTMYLSSIDKNRKIYYSMRKDSILHSKKRIDYDWLTLDKITDEFYNKKKNLTFEVIYIKGSLFRKEKRINRLIARKGCEDVVVGTLNESRKDSLLKAWGFDNKLYKQDNRF
ncbi:MAG: hypothetical protein Q8909_07115 [Bacteroidota bacterium]|nr:hypothetical protein [Bacteroidota bacterium]